MKKLLFALFFFGLFLIGAVSAETQLKAAHTCRDGSSTCVANQYTLIYLNATTPVAIYQEYSLTNTSDRSNVILTGYGDQIIATDYYAIETNLTTEDSSGSFRTALTATRGQGAFSNYIYINYPTTTVCDATYKQRKVIKFDITTNTTSTVTSYCSTVAAGGTTSAAISWNAVNNTITTVSNTRSFACAGTAICKFDMNPSSGAVTNAYERITGFADAGGITSVKVFNEVPQKVIITNADGYIGNQTLNANWTSSTILYDNGAVFMGRPLIFESEVNTNNTNNLYALFLDNQSSRYDIKYAPYNCSNTCTPTSLVATADSHKLSSLYQTATGTVFFTYLKNSDNTTYYNKFCPFGDNAFELGSACNSIASGICTDETLNACSTENPGYFCNSAGELVPQPGQCACATGDTWTGTACVNQGTQFNNSVIDVYFEDTQNEQNLLGIVIEPFKGYARVKWTIDGHDVSDGSCTITLSNGTSYALSYVTGAMDYIVSNSYKAGTVHRDITNYYEVQLVGIQGQNTNVHCVKGNIDVTLPLVLLQNDEQFTFTPSISSSPNPPLNMHTVQSGDSVDAKINLQVKYWGVSGQLTGNRPDKNLPSCIFRSDDFAEFAYEPNLINVLSQSGNNPYTDMRFRQTLDGISGFAAGTYYYDWLCYNHQAVTSSNQRNGHNVATVNAITIVPQECSEEATETTVSVPTGMVQNSQTDTFVITFDGTEGNYLDSRIQEGVVCNYYVNYTSNGTNIISDTVTLGRLGIKEVLLNGSQFEGSQYTLTANCAVQNQFSQCYAASSASDTFEVTASNCGGNVTSCGISTCNACNGTSIITCNDGFNKKFGETCQGNIQCVSAATQIQEADTCLMHSGFNLAFNISRDVNYCDVAPKYGASLLYERGAPLIHDIQCTWDIYQTYSGSTGFLTSIPVQDSDRQDNYIPLLDTGFWRSSENVCVDQAVRTYTLTCGGNAQLNNSADVIPFSVTASFNRTTRDRGVIGVCTDSTSKGYCSESKPYFCTNDLTLVENAQNKDKKYPVPCGCPGNYTANGESCFRGDAEMANAIQWVLFQLVFNPVALLIFIVIAFLLTRRRQDGSRRV